MSKKAEKKSSLTIDQKNQLSLNSSIARYLNATNYSILYQISTYEKLIDYTKNFFSSNRGDLSSMEVTNSIINYNNIINQYTSLLKEDYNSLKSKYDQNKSEINGKIDQLSDKLDKAREDSFILMNALKERDSHIKKINNDITDMKEDIYGYITERESYAHHAEKRVSTCQNLELDFYQTLLSRKSKKHNKEQIKTERLNTEASAIKTKLLNRNKNKTIGFIQNGYNGDNRVDQEGNLTASSLSEGKEDPFKLYFPEFENEEKCIEPKEIISEKRVTNENQTLATEDTINVKQKIPKLDLKQIEVNKAGIDKVLIKNTSFDSPTQKSFDVNVSLTGYYNQQDSQIDLQINNLTKRIESLKKKIISNHELICKFKHFYLRLKSKCKDDESSSY